MAVVQKIGQVKDSLRNKSHLNKIDESALTEFKVNQVLDLLQNPLPSWKEWQINY